MLNSIVAHFFSIRASTIHTLIVWVLTTFDIYRAPKQQKQHKMNIEKREEVKNITKWIFTIVILIPSARSTFTNKENVLSLSICDKFYASRYTDHT